MSENFKNTKNKNINKVAVVFLTIASLFCLSACGQNKPSENASTQATSSFKDEAVCRGIFSWFPDAVTDKELIDLAKRDGITEIYQMFSNKTSSGDVIELAKAAAKENIALYGVVGDPQWALEPDAAELLTELERIKDYNSGLEKETAIKGIILDVEPHALEEWKEDSAAVIESFTKMLKSCYENREGLEIYLCIPFYYDKLGFEEELEKWLKDYCDGLYIMNYSLGHESNNIEYEVGLARKYNKKLITIYELNSPDGKEIAHYNTYYGKTMADLNKNYLKIAKEYNYSKLGMAFHEYRAYKVFIS